MKMKDLQQYLKKKGIDFALFYNANSLQHDSALLYFAQYSGIGALVVPKKKNAFLVVPEMECEKAKISGIKVLQWEKGMKLFAFIKSKIKGRKIAIDKAKVSLNGYREMKRNFKRGRMVDISNVFARLREVKTKKEVSIIKKACEITDRILLRCIRNLKELKTEANAAAFLEHETKKIGCGLAFPPIVASGKGASQPHYAPQPIKLRKGFCVIDFGIRYKGYCSDITRTVYIGKPSEKDRRLYQLLADAQERTIQNLKAGKKCSTIYKEALQYLGGYGKYFIHGLGHGIGVEVHELPNLKDASKDRIKEGSVFTIEPGIYFRTRFGIRIEDDILMLKRPVVLTKTTKKFIFIN